MKISGWTDEVKAFLEEWESPQPYIIAHTSGSTGNPKEIKLLKSDMLASARATNHFFGLTASSRLLMPLSGKYIAGKMMVVRAMLAECELIVERPSLSPFSQDIGHVSLLPIVPAQIGGLLSKPWVSLEVIANLIVGGGPVSVADEELLYSLGYNAFATYGMTETCSHVALRPFGNKEFRALPAVSFSVDSENCLVIHSNGKYSWSDIATNDVVELLSSECFVWKGRRDFVINSGGVKIHPEEEETRLRNAALEGEFYITSTAHDVWGAQVTLVVEGEGSSSRSEDILSLCRKVLSRYAVPRRIVFVKKIPRTASGKIIRNKF